jgi:phosphatidylinositol alpha-mannosyltransferase
VPGGVREHVINLDRQYRALGHQVVIIAPASKGAALAPNVVRISGFVLPIPGSGSLARISLSPAVYGRLRDVLLGGRFDVIHIHEPLMPAVSLAALSLARAPMVGTIHGYRDALFLYRYLRTPLDRLMNRLSGRTAVSDDARAWAAQYFPGDYRIISDGVDVGRFADPAIAPIPRYGDGKLNLLFVGRMEKRKGLAYLMQALPRVSAAVPGVRLIVVGAFTKQEQVPWEEFARRNALSDVDFVGFVSAEEMPRYYRSTHVFCAPSTGYEALGIVLLEAMAASLPIVTTDIKGYRTVVSDGVEGLRVPPADSEALAAALISLLSDENRRREMGERGRVTVQRYDWPRIARQTLNLYEECIRAKQGKQI